MRKPGLGEANLGAVTGAVVGAVGGLFAVAVPYAILTHDWRALSAARTLGLIGFLVSTPIGWLLGGQFGPRLEGLLRQRAAGIVGGVVGGLIPVGGFLYWGWRLVQN
jgi:hypothetical protein